MISTNDVRPGMALNLPEGLFSVTEHQHVKPGKGKAFVRMKLKNVRTGAVIDRTFRAGESVNQARIDRRDFTFLYRDDIGFNFMDGETYEQLSVSMELVGSHADFMTDGMTLRLAMFEGTPVDMDLPTSVELEVTFAEPGVKGDRVSGATKPVTLSTGRVIQAPLFVEQGDVVKVDTRTGDYMTRVS
ncbi:MAG: elongation factor P [Acidimicrobiia bacterium]|nr:MAG: elongation factor P [Acidimicrobiia bacterium]